MTALILKWHLYTQVLLVLHIEIYLYLTKSKRSPVLVSNLYNMTKHSTWSRTRHSQTSIGLLYKDHFKRRLRAAVVEWLSSWLAEQEVRGSIPGLATWIFRYWLSPASKSRYGWNTAKIGVNPQSNQPTNQPTRTSIRMTDFIYSHRKSKYSISILNIFNFFSRFVIYKETSTKMYNTKELMHRHCGNSNRAPRWTFTDPCKPEVRPGAREESASPAWLAAPAMNARDTTKVYIWRLNTGCGVTLYRKCHSHNTLGKKA